ncbi:MAG: RNA-binding protein [Candidatus Taylorbacteria bacterium]|nr:RNA-binding protein [Candidatus Taylorbacteria bacterium]
MAKKLYVGNLSYGTTADSLKAAFSKVGTVISANVIGTVISANVISDKMTGRSRGFGFVEMEDADADKAVSSMHGTELDGRTLTVNEARPMSERPPRRSGGGGYDRGGDDRRSSY